MIKHILTLIWNKKGSNALMILEIFLSFLVLFFALTYLFFNLEKINEPMGFETQDRWMISLDNVYKLDSIDAVNVMKNLKRNLLAQEEIEAVTFTTTAAPFIHSQNHNGSSLNGFRIVALMIDTDLDFEKTVNSNIIDGRWFNEDDLNASVPPVLVNKYFMDKYYNGKSMIDSTILFDDPHKIIGVIEEYRYLGEFHEPETSMFFLKDYIHNQGHVILKMQPNTPASFEEKLARIVRESTGTNGSIIQHLEKMKIEDSRKSWLMLYALMFICIFLCLNVAFGLFGVLSYNINKRKAEIGLRQALGAHSFDITKQFILEIIILTGIALIIGIFFAIQIPVFNVTEYKDELFFRAIFFASIIILTLVFACALLPSLQAAKITPANSLHED